MNVSLELWPVSRNLINSKWDCEKCLTVLQTNARTDALARLGLSLTLFRHSLRTIVTKHVLLFTYVYFLPSMLVNKFFDDIKVYWSNKWLVSFSCKYDGSAHSLKVFLLCTFYFLVVNNIYFIKIASTESVLQFITVVLAKSKVRDLVAIWSSIGVLVFWRREGLTLVRYVKLWTEIFTISWSSSVSTSYTVIDF